ncbi:MAG: hypothetical protein WAV41_01840 [Microgenomates group bacterium]
MAKNETKSKGRVLTVLDLQSGAREHNLKPEDVTKTYETVPFFPRFNGRALPHLRVAITEVKEQLTVAQIGKIVATTINLRPKIGSDKISTLESIALEVQNLMAERHLAIANVQLRKTK